jgi:hypothetical protein
MNLLLSRSYEGVPAMGRERTRFLPLLRPLGFRCIRTEGMALLTHLREGLFSEVRVDSVLT